MPAIQPLYDLIGVNVSQLSQEEKMLLDADLFVHVCNELIEIFRQQNQQYFHFMKFTLKMENTMLESGFMQSIIRDILSTGEYSLQGIACYTDTHEDVIQELASGLNTKPSAIVLRRTIELHKSVRHDLYCAIKKKIVSEYSSVA